MQEDPEPGCSWDEYQWERFLQQQDKKTERYMELLEKYLDDPNRDQIIAREMGWSHLLDEQWTEQVDAAFEDEMEEGSQEEDEEQKKKAEEEFFEMHPLYRASFALTVWIDEMLEELGDVQNHPAAIKLATQSAIASAKLAAALSDDDIDEIGMTIAYLKRALKALTNAMEGALQLEKIVKLDPKKSATLHHRMFQVRDETIALMGEFRAEWRRRHGV